MIPFIGALVGTSIGICAALVPLCIGAAPFIARQVENRLLEEPNGLIEAARALGASTLQIVTGVGQNLQKIKDFVKAHQSTVVENTAHAILKDGAIKGW